MALFQKKPQVNSSAPLYSLGLNKSVLIVGLGNPGREYDKTRHNVGFACVDAFIENQELSAWVQKKDLKCLESTGTIGSTRVVVIKPTTFMNNSGEAVQAVSNFYKIPLDQIVAVYDELAIPFGQIRMRQGGESAGHNGVKSLIQHIGKDFGRIRVGVSNEHADKADSADFVLAKFSKDELAEMPNLTREVNSILTEYLYGTGLPHDTRSFIV
jgi:peptidyl-tRNA hydrolase, PTH1 family